MKSHFLSDGNLVIGSKEWQGPSTQATSACKDRSKLCFPKGDP